MYNLQQIQQAVISSLSDELRQKQYQGRDGLAGYCYVASEAIYHLYSLVGERREGYRDVLRSKRMVHEETAHWFLVNRSAAREESVIDVTSSQFKTTPDYSQAKYANFLTSLPSKRAQIVIERATKLLESTRLTSV